MNSDGTPSADPRQTPVVPDIEVQLLQIAYGSMRMNLLLTAGSFLLGTAVLWAWLPHAAMLIWLANILLMAGIGLVIDAGYRRSGGAPARFRFWKNCFTFNVWHAGAVWGLGPALMLGTADGNQATLLAVMVLASSAVVVNSVAEQRAAMFGFISLALLPPAVTAWIAGNGAFQSTSVVLLLGYVAFMVTGANSHRTLRAAVAGRTRLRAVLDNSLDAILGVDDWGRITDWNLRAEAIFGWSRDEALGRRVDETIIPPRHRDAHRHGMTRFIASGGRGMMQRRIELTALRRDGGEFPIELVIAPLRIDNAWHFTGFITDISERKAAELALVEAREIAELASRAKSNFLSSMSHELRTPMNAILGFAQILELDKHLQAEQRDFVGEIIKGGNHLLELINDVLEMSRIEAGTIHLSIAALDLATVVEECRALIRPLVDARGLTLRIAVPPSATVRGDRVRLKQSLLNLLSNAVKYNREGGTIHLDAAPAADNRLRITVSDTGQGIPAASMAELFKPFSRLGAEHGAIEGTGIGLSITRRLVELMDGSVGAESSPGVGSRFWIELPVGDAEPAWQNDRPAARALRDIAPTPAHCPTSRHHRPE